jgi:mercuric ion transport protein
MTVELIYDRDCPNVAWARTNLIEALISSGLDARWTEWERGNPASPTYVEAYGSPTVLVDGNDVAGSGTGIGGASCRLYRNGPDGFDGAPSVVQIAAALACRADTAHSAGLGSAGSKSSLVAAPGIALAFLPKLACPACWPAYAGLLSSLGLGFLWQQDYLLPLTVAFLLLALGALAFRAHTRRGYGPLALGLTAAVAVLAGKFALDSNAMMYAGIAGLLAAALWNAWPARTDGVGCPACASGVSSTDNIQKGGERS